MDVKVTQLLSAIHQSTLEDQARSMAAVILRRLFASEFQEFYSVVSVMPERIVRVARAGVLDAVGF